MDYAIYCHSLLRGDFTPQLGDSFDLFNFSAVNGTFSSINLPTPATGLNWDISYLGVTGELNVVPEPATLALLGLGGLILYHRRRSRNRKV